MLRACACFAKKASHVSRVQPRSTNMHSKAAPAFHCPSPCASLRSCNNPRAPGTTLSLLPPPRMANRPAKTTPRASTPAMMAPALLEPLASLLLPCTYCFGCRAHGEGAQPQRLLPSNAMPQGCPSPPVPARALCMLLPGHSAAHSVLELAPPRGQG